MQYLYIIPMVIALLLSLFLIYSISASKGKLNDEKPFESDFYNDLHRISYLAPFRWFVNPNDKDKKVEEIKKEIAEANLGNKISYRSFITIQITIFILSVFLFFILSIVIDNAQTIIHILFNIKIGNMADAVITVKKLKMIIAMILLVFTLLPRFWLKKKAENNKFFYLKDIPIVQLFIILMLRSKRTLSEVLYILSRTNTRYKTTFETGYRIYLRDKSEGFEYLKSCFTGTKFEETLTILQDYSEYSHADTIVILENNMKEMVDYTSNLKRRNDLSKLLYSQASLAIPFMALLVLGLVPIAMYAMSFLHSTAM